MEEARKQQEKRLKEIQAMTFAGLPDEAILEILAERKHLENLMQEYALQDQAEEASKQKKKALLQEEKEVEEKIEHLNEEIRPDKADDELLALIKERKDLEAELLHIEEELGEPLPRQLTEVAPLEEVVQSVPEQEPAEAAEEASAEVATETESPIEAEEKKEELFKKGDFGEIGIQPDRFKDSGDLERYVHELESSRDSLGSFLQSLPREARSHKEFMLKVAAIDPAYAMHYAVDQLRRDEDFHIQIAMLPNTRGTGNPLAEMDPDMRTERVVLAATREDFRNVRFVSEDMSLYDDIVAVAKKGALEQAKALKNAINVTVFIPKVLQKDVTFMEQVAKVVQKN